MNKLDFEKVIVNINGDFGHVYDIIYNDDDQIEKLNKANESKNEDIELYLSHIEKYPDRIEYWKKQLDETMNKEFIIMTYEEFEQRQKEYYLNLPLKEITEDDFNEALNCLPPIQWVTIAGTNEFLVSEAYTDSYHSQYARKNGKYYTKLVCRYDRSTWIHNLI